MKMRFTSLLIIISSMVFFHGNFLIGQHIQNDHEKISAEVSFTEQPSHLFSDGAKELLPPGWEFINTDLIQGIIIPQSAMISVYGDELAEGSWLGVFYTDEFGNEKCGGARQYNPNLSLILTAFGNDNFTPQKDGFAYGEKYKWRIFDNETLLEHPAIATYNPFAPNPHGTFGGGFCEILKLEAVLNIQVSLTSGWSGISFPFTPLEQDVSAIFSAIESQLEILQNNAYVLWPEEEINTFPYYWLPTFGAQIKVSGDVAFDVAGVPGVRTIELGAGWNYLPVMSPCNVNAVELFSPINDKIDIVKSIAGTTLYWPAMGVTSLEVLETGKAYLVKLNQPATIIFPKCNQLQQ